MPTRDLQVTAGTDDARNAAGNGAFNATVTTQHLGLNAGVDYWAGLRFVNVAVPQGAVIRSASLDLYSSGVAAGTSAPVVFHGEKSANPATFSNTTAGKPEGRARTTAAVTKTFDPARWNPEIGFGIDVVDVTPLVQEIVNQPAFASGNAIALVGHNNGAADNNYIGFNTHDFTGNLRGAKLTITYGSTTPPPTGVGAVQDGGTIAVSWTDGSTTETGYEVGRRRGDGGWHLRATLPAGATGWTDTDVAAGYTYTYRVRPLLPGGPSDWLSSSAVTTTGTKAWTAWIEAWLFPGPPAEDADEEYRDGRVIHVLKPEYHRVEDDGTMSVRSEEELGENGYSPANAADVRAHSDEQYDTVSCGDFGMIAMLDSPAKRAAAISTLVDFCVDSGFTGVCVDFERFGTWTAAVHGDYKAWLRTLGTALHDEGKKLQICGPPITNEDEQNRYEWAYEDFATTTEVDRVVMMLYDYQYDEGVGQSVQPAQWARNGCAWLLARIPDVDRIGVGLPNYGYHGPIGTYEITPDTKDASLTHPGHTTATRNADGEMTWTNGDDDNTYVYQDSAGINTKRELIEDEGIKHISVWHLGGNDWFTGRAEMTWPDGE
ncbi:glycosyl hydrolase family 18 protein [Umezawaea sp. Da 62-37]|uniref:glycosyl hydrolase family 18 protein n=1 Tax=Umezawaea sp. Da 62-37 TaxID=3075927 RepID=UPI0028F6EF58|nr:glycosyl hydrolase family 18 protein [Umezawaea sp. Da 62-37]WNV87024.1 glycosyl hydrolase family 18 protein [Umezawaea sp. Da 62-37]